MHFKERPAQLKYVYILKESTLMTYREIYEILRLYL